MEKVVTFVDISSLHSRRRVERGRY